MIKTEQISGLKTRYHFAKLNSEKGNQNVCTVIGLERMSIKVGVYDRDIDKFTPQLIFEQYLCYTVAIGVFKYFIRSYQFIIRKEIHIEKEIITNNT